MDLTILRHNSRIVSWRGVNLRAHETVESEVEMFDENEPDTKIVEIVRMEEDGSLALSHVCLTKGMSPGMKMWHSKPGSPDFIDYQQRHGVTKPKQDKQSPITTALTNSAPKDKSFQHRSEHKRK